MKLKWKEFFSNYENAIFAWFIIVGTIALGIYFSVDRRVIAVFVILIGIASHAFAALIAWIGLVPLVGPFIAQILTLPFVWILNGIGYIVSIVAIKKGYSKDVISYRMATVTLIIGIIIGYILGKLI